MLKSFLHVFPATMVWITLFVAFREGWTL